MVFSAIKQADKTKQEQLLHMKPLVLFLEMCENVLPVNLGAFFILWKDKHLGTRFVHNNVKEWECCKNMKSQSLQRFQFTSVLVLLTVDDCLSRSPYL